VPSPPLVLLIDDEPEHVEMYQLSLETAGFEVISAYTGGDGVRLARARQPDAIVLDLRLPDITGWEVCGLLKSDPQSERIPVVILTAVDSPGLLDQAARAGCAAHLLKPCFPDQLIKVVRTVLPGHFVA
jgi:CheY-like chemotaxis protein